MPVPHGSITTIEELLALPEDGLRHELLDGEHVVTPAPEYPHQSALAGVYNVLYRVVGGRDDLQLLWSPADIVLGPKTLVQPDLFVLRVQPGKPFRSWKEVGTPLLVIEALSPSTAPRDRGKKRRIYQRAGVAEYWIVDLDARLIERWRPDDARPEIIDQIMRWELPGGAKGEFGMQEILPPLA
ncbi:MAG: Uma2 family endonuclease [Gemmatimonadetes bacterium]|nr:Uma2 family endonuclease [Gemmatimonadota bacterium]